MLCHKPSQMRTRLIFRCLNFATMVLFISSRMMDEARNPWLLVAVDASVVGCGCTFLAFAYSRNLLTYTSIRLGLLMWSAFIYPMKVSLVPPRHLSFLVLLTSTT